MTTTERIYDKDRHKIGEVHRDNGDVEIELDGKYFRHLITAPDGLGVGEYVIKEVKVEIPADSGEEEEPKTFSDGELKKDLFEAVVSVMKDLTVKYQNVVTWLYDQDGNKIGSLEEGIDTWLQLSLRTKNCPWIKIWHYPYPDRNIKNKFGKKLKVEVAG